MPAADSELLTSVAGSWIIAVVAATLFYAVCRVWLRLSGSYRYRSIFAPVLLHAPGYALRRQLRTRGAELRVVLATLLLLPIFFGAVMLAWPGELEANLNEMRWLLMTVLATATLGFLLHRLWTLVVAQHRTRYALSADVAVSHALERVMKRDFSVFHDVCCDNAVASKVVVGNRGVFAVKMFVYPRSRRAHRAGEKARYDGQRVTFPDGNSFELTREAGELAQAVSGYLARKVGKALRVCPVLVLPGWDVECEVQPSFPLVNERNIDMVTEWTKPESFLMKEEEEAIQDDLSGTCRDRRYKAA